jgi:gluconolactonase
MTKKTLLFLGALCTFGFYSCQKDMKDKVASTPAAANKNKPVDMPPLSLTNGPQSEVIFEHDAPVPRGPRTFTEGPAVDKFGNVFFTDQPFDKIYRWDAATGQVSLWKTGTGRANGMAFDKNGRLIACADLHGEIWSMDKFGNAEVLVDNYKGKLLNGPNDVWINPKDRGMYITDPMFPKRFADLNAATAQLLSERLHAADSHAGSVGKIAVDDEYLADERAGFSALFHASALRVRSRLRPGRWWPVRKHRRCSSKSYEVRRRAICEERARPPAPHR